MECFIVMDIRNNALPPHPKIHREHKIFLKNNSIVVEGLPYH